MNEYTTTAIWKKTKKVLKANANKRDMTLVTYLHWLAQIDKQEIKEGLRDEKKAEFCKCEGKGADYYANMDIHGDCKECGLQKF